MSFALRLRQVPHGDPANRSPASVPGIFFADLMDHGAWSFARTVERQEPPSAISLTMDARASTQENP